MKFYKYHGTGNDFILLDDVPENPSELAKRICHRHMGIGADGLIYPETSNTADIKFNYYNSDGSLAPMCGNGMRCFVKFLMDKKRIENNYFIVETLAGLIPVTYDSLHQMVTIDLGKPQFDLAKPYVNHAIHRLETQLIQVDDQIIETYTVFLGTLHTIVYVKEYMDIKKIGPLLSNNGFFPEKTNVNFVSVTSRNHQHVQTYERGAGWTLSCGTGVAASAIVSNLLGFVDPLVETDVPGGHLVVEVGQSITLTGPAVIIATGQFEV